MTCFRCSRSVLSGLIMVRWSRLSFVPCLWALGANWVSRSDLVSGWVVFWRKSCASFPSFGGGFGTVRPLLSPRTWPSVWKSCPFCACCGSWSDWNAPPKTSGTVCSPPHSSARTVDSYFSISPPSSYSTFAPSSSTSSCSTGCS